MTAGDLVAAEVTAENAAAVERRHRRRNGGARRLLPGQIRMQVAPDRSILELGRSEKDCGLGLFDGQIHDFCRELTLSRRAMLGQLRTGALSQLHERRQPMFDSDGSHSNAYWRGKSSHAIKMGRYEVPRPQHFPKCDAWEQAEGDAMREKLAGYGCAPEQIRTLCP